MKDSLVNQVVDIITDENSDERDIVYKLKKAIHEVELQNVIIKESNSLEYLIAQSLDYIREKKGQALLLKTGYKLLDEDYGGFSRGEVIVIGARPGMGKSLLMTNLALNIARQNGVLYFSYNLTETQLGVQLLSTLTGISAMRLHRGPLFESDMKHIKHVEQQLTEFKLYVNESCANSMTAFRALCEKHIYTLNIKAIFVDYIQLMGAHKQRNFREQEISYVSHELRSIAKEYNVCVVIASQLNRAVEYRTTSKRPWLSDLRDSGALEQVADKVIFLYRPQYYGLLINDDGTSTKGMGELIFAKNRNGLIGEFRISHDEHYTTFMNYELDDFSFSFDETRLNELLSSRIKDMEDDESVF